MTEEMFTGEVDEWLKDVRREALELYTSGVMSEHCLGLAIQIANSQATKRAMNRQKLGILTAARQTLPGN